jgi:hypothetical protein
MLGRLFLFLLLISVALTAHEVVIVNETALISVTKADLVLDVDGCAVYVYIVHDFGTAKTPLLNTKPPEVRRPAAPLPAERLLDVALKAFGPDVEVRVAVVRPRNTEKILNDTETTQDDVEYIWTSVSARNVEELREQLQRILEMPVFYDIEDARDAAKRNREKAAAVATLEKRLEDTSVIVTAIPRNLPGYMRGIPLYPINIVSVNSSRVLEILSRLEEVAGGMPPPTLVSVYAYRMDEEEVRRLVHAAEVLERELGTVKPHPNGVEGIIHVMGCNPGPCFLIFPYPNGTTPPDIATAERVVRRFFKLAGVCKSPTVAEFWPKTGYELFSTPAYPHLPAVAAGVTLAAALIAINIIINIITRKKNKF